MHQRLKQLAPILIQIPAGECVIGLTPAQAAALAEQLGMPLEQFLEETPQQQVALDAFQISRGPISCAEYMAFVTATDHPTPLYWGGHEPPAGLSDHPVVEVDLNDARWYCRWLSTATDREFRLPTEAEWERAARGDDQRLFPWGDQWAPGYCNIGASDPGATTPIGSYPRDTSPYGCVDMAGNVEEWTATKYKRFPGSNAAPPQNRIVTRGGSWNAAIALARCTSRCAREATNTSAARGFRIVCVDQ